MMVILMVALLSPVRNVGFGTTTETSPLCLLSALKLTEKSFGASLLKRNSTGTVPAFSRTLAADPAGPKKTRPEGRSVKWVTS